MLISKSPWTEEVWRTYPYDTAEQINRKLDLSQKTAREAWTKPQNWPQRAQYLSVLAKLLRSQVDELSLLAAMEMGKPLNEGKAEVLKCAQACEYFRQFLPQVMQGSHRSFNSKYLFKNKINSTQKPQTAFVDYSPFGPLLLIMPWNFPYWQVIRTAAAQLAMGNPVLLKHSSLTPQASQALERVFKSAGFPSEAFQSIYLSGAEANALIEDSRIRGVVFTGSTRVGQLVSQQSGRHLKKTVLELGGSDPFILSRSGNFSKALETGIYSRMINGGQSCLNAKRFFIHETHYENFISQLKLALPRYEVGDPRDPATLLGPLSHADSKTTALSQILSFESVGEEAFISHKNKSQWEQHPTAFLPRVFQFGADPKKYLYSRDEIFAPVFMVHSYKNITDVYQELESSPLALGATLFSEDFNEIEEAESAITTGILAINTLCQSHPALPVGGRKLSGMGRECGIEGMIEFTSAKTIWKG